jgi:hypothetical protein
MNISKQNLNKSYKTKSFKMAIVIVSIFFSILAIGFFIQAVIEQEFFIGWTGMCIISMIISYVFYAHRNVSTNWNDDCDDWNYNNH